MSAPTLDEVLDILHEIAPLELAAEWDNVGVLLRPNREKWVLNRQAGMETATASSYVGHKVVLQLDPRPGTVAETIPR